MEVHRVRRAAFLDAAQQLIETKGYEEMAIQDVLDQLEASKGAFYHYFDSKEALLDAVVDRFAEAGMAAVAPILNDPDLPALRKLESFFRGIASFKAEQKELVLAVMEVWLSDGNALLREKLRRLSGRLLRPVLTEVIQQGVDEGAVTVSSPTQAARIIVSLIQGDQDLAGELLLGRRAGTVSFELVAQTFAASAEVFERILGVPHGSITVMDKKTLHFWFG
ncbi:MAG: hypothetical protein QOK05_963 [Chloroflexota bacterium]|nr:hypothetical protein [Chloroflexota bacterium]